MVFYGFSATPAVPSTPVNKFVTVERMLDVNYLTCSQAAPFADRC